MKRKRRATATNTEMITELRFPPGGTTGVQRLCLFLGGFGVLALVVSVLELIVALNGGKVLFGNGETVRSADHMPPSVPSGIGGIVFGGLILLLAAAGIKNVLRENRRCWGRFRKPAAILDATGVRYLMRPVPVLIPDSDIEQIRVSRNLATNPNRGLARLDTYVDVRLKPDAAVMSGGVIQVPETRRLLVGKMEALDVSYPAAVTFLRKIARPKLVIGGSVRNLGART